MPRLAVAALVLVCGCSFTMGTLPAGHNPKFEPHCDGGIGKPLIDLAGTALFGGGGGVVFAEPDRVSLVNARYLIGVPGLVAGALFGVSAIVGLVRGGRCRSARRAHDAFQHRDVVPPSAP